MPAKTVRVAICLALACALAWALGVDAGVIEGGRPIGGLIEMAPDWQPTQYVRYFAPNDPLYPQQWHLENAAGAPDVNAAGPWSRGVTGAGVTIGIVDDGLQHAHPDLSPNYVAADSWDFGEDDADPSPVSSGDRHGTAVAGVAAARGGNALGVTGAAPEAGLAGLRIDFDLQTTQMFSDATLYHSSGGNTDIDIKNHSYGISVPYVSTPNEVAALRTSASYGTLHTVAAGNERDDHGRYFDVDGDGYLTPDVDWAADGDANKKDLQHAQESICVAALSYDGRYSYYSNWGANVFCTTPSNDSGTFGITTTDRVGTSGYSSGDYTSFFGGTSAAAPLAAGVLALGRQLRPDMDERLAKHILARTCAMVDPADPDWQTNAAGFHFNENYGFGLVDADAFTLLAQAAPYVTPLLIETTGVIPVGQAIPGDAVWPIVLAQTFQLDGTVPLEELEVHLDVAHTWRGDLEAYLISPNATVSRLMSENPADSFDDLDWTFVTNAFWGEVPQGEWELLLVDWYPEWDGGTWNSFSVVAKMGELVPEPCSLALLAGGVGVLVARRRRR